MKPIPRSTRTPRIEARRLASSTNKNVSHFVTPRITAVCRKLQFSTIKSKQHSLNKTFDVGTPERETTTYVDNTSHHDDACLNNQSMSNIGHNLGVSTSAKHDQAVLSDLNAKSSVQRKRRKSRLTYSSAKLKNNIGPYANRAFGSGEDGDLVYKKRKYCIGPGEEVMGRLATEIAKVVGMKGTHRGLAIHVLFAGIGCSFSNYFRVEHFNIKDFINGPEAFVEWLVSLPANTRQRYLLDQRKSAFVGAMIKRGKQGYNKKQSEKVSK